jgi:hypothetical protein
MSLLILTVIIIYEISHPTISAELHLVRFAICILWLAGKQMQCNAMQGGAMQAVQMRGLLSHIRIDAAAIWRMHCSVVVNNYF